MNRFSTSPLKKRRGDVDVDYQASFGVGAKGQSNKIVVNMVFTFDIPALSSNVLYEGVSVYHLIIGVLALSGLVMKITKNYTDRRLKGKEIKPMISVYEDIQEEQEKLL